jgi:hypothetical protein
MKRASFSRVLSTKEGLSKELAESFLDRKPSISVGDADSLLDKQNNTSLSLKEKGNSNTGVITKSIIFGLINGITMLPTMFSYTAIIFSDAFFRKDMGLLSKLMLFSSVVHQSVFTMLSALPFAVGQVQDAGLIFLSKIATDMVNEMTSEDLPPEDIMVTVLYTLALSTATLGLALVLTGWLKLADLGS